jgi:hypothetical protein
VTVTVTSVEGDTATFDVQVDEETRVAHDLGRMRAWRPLRAPTW